jgi:hypothetical protein
MNTERNAMNAQRINLDANEGFTAKPLTADLARRQLHVSLGVMGVFVAAGLAIFSTVGVAPSDGKLQVRAKITVQQPHLIRPMTADASRAANHTGS